MDWKSSAQQWSLIFGGMDVLMQGELSSLFMTSFVIFISLALM
jgi:hypothetical protein